MPFDSLVARIDAQAGTPLNTGDALARLRPPGRFDQVRFETYLPMPEHPSQSAALAACSVFAAGVRSDAGGSILRRWVGRRGAAPPEQRPGVYLDGGFGVGKTHLLASIWHAAPGPKGYTSFAELTSLIGALGFHDAVAALAGLHLLCVDEFELDDPGDTVLLSTFLQRLVDVGVRIAATSNTLPDRLGEGRFAADDFLREIQGLSAHFEVLRIDGPDYRHRHTPGEARVTDRAALVRPTADDDPAAPDRSTSLDTFAAVDAALGRIHPARLADVVRGLHEVRLDGVAQITEQVSGLRWVALIDRLYDLEIPVRAAGIGLQDLFGDTLLASGYRKKYRRATSRVVALTWEDGA